MVKININDVTNTSFIDSVSYYPDSEFINIEDPVDCYV